jgi:hypothetical protein
MNVVVYRYDMLARVLLGRCTGYHSGAGKIGNNFSEPEPH